VKSPRISLLLILPSLIMLSGCTPQNLHPLEGRLFFAVHEAYPGGEEGVEPSLLLSMETEMIYGCCNYSIDAVIHHLGALLSVDIRGIQQPDFCLTALGPANLGRFLEPEEGTYSLEFSDGPKKNVYELRVSQESVTITGEGSRLGGFAQPEYEVFWRYPTDSFAVMCGTTTDTAWVFEDFLARLQAAVDIQEHEFPSYGEIGYPRAPQGSQVNHPARYFIYGDETGFAAAGDVLRTYVRDVIGGFQGVHIWLLNWKNESFRSWQMAGTPD